MDWAVMDEEVEVVAAVVEDEEDEAMVEVGVGEAEGVAEVEDVTEP